MQIRAGLEIADPRRTHHKKNDELCLRMQRIVSPCAALRGTVGTQNRNRSNCGSPSEGALQENLPVRGVAGAFAGVSSAGYLRGSAGGCGSFRGSDPVLVTLGDCWTLMTFVRLRALVRRFWLLTKVTL